MTLYAYSEEKEDFLILESDKAVTPHNTSIEKIEPFLGLITWDDSAKYKSEHIGVYRRLYDSKWAFEFESKFKDYLTPQLKALLLAQGVNLNDYP